jgi:hypothetical protein
VIEALLDFFQMVDTKHEPVANASHSAHVLSEEERTSYITSTLDKFLDEYVFFDENVEDLVTDDVWCYAVNLLKSFMLLSDFRDSVATGNGKHLSVIRKQLLVKFFATPGFNEFAIEMLINTLQNQVLLSEAEAYHCQWAATVNWSGGAGRNIEIDLFQENMNSEMKKLVRSMGANKTQKAISRASKASGGVSKIVESFEKQVNLHRRSSTHSHKSSVDDERLILADLRALKPFQMDEERSFESFTGISSDPTHLFDQDKFDIWLARHKKNILRHYPVGDAQESSEEED